MVLDNILKHLKNLQGTKKSYELLPYLSIGTLGYFALFVPPEQAANLPEDINELIDQESGHEPGVQ